MPRSNQKSEFKLLNDEITACRLCPRLVRWRESVAQTKAPRFSGENYWAKPVPGFGDAKAKLLIVGLAPAAHGANRTGRMFTGDRSGEWLYRALHKAGFANQPHSVSRDDGLKLHNCYITAAARCAPPGNKPTPAEFRNCRRFLREEVQLLPNTRVILGLGKLAFDAAFDLMRSLKKTTLASRPKFAHGTEIWLSDSLTLIGSYHPSQQNTFTGRLTLEMWEGVFEGIHKILENY